MKRPKQLPAVERITTRSASTATVAGVTPSKLVGRQPAPACRAIASYGCNCRSS